MKSFSTLTKGSRYTLVRFGTMGFLHSTQFELIDYRVEPYAQYPESEVLIGKPKAKRRLIAIRLLPNDDFVLYEGWVDVQTEMYVESETRPDGMTCKHSLLSFDREYFEIAKRSTTATPLLERITPCDASDTKKIQAKNREAV